MYTKAKIIRNIISTAAMLIGMLLLLGSLMWSGLTAFKFYTYKGSTDGIVTEYYSPIKAFSEYKWPVIEYSVANREYTYKGRSEVSARPYPDNMSLIVRYDLKQPANAVTSLDFYDGLKFSAFGIVGAFILFFISRVAATGTSTAKRSLAAPKEDDSRQRITYTDSEPTEATGTFKGHFNEVGSDLVFVLAPGEYASGWQFIDGEWYYFDPENHNACVRGCWRKLGGDIFCFKDDGSVLKGWYSDNTNWFLLNSSEKNGRIGRLFTGWVQMGEGGALSYFNESDTTLPTGAMFINRIAPGNLQVDAEGRYYPKNETGLPIGTYVMR